MKPIVKNYAKEINDLHKEIFGAVKVTLEKAIRIGKLLTECKEKTPHGEWMSWMKDNLEFSEKTAQRYILVFENRTKNDTMSDLTKVYQSLIEHKPKPKQEVEEYETDEYKLPEPENQKVSGLEDARPEENIVDAVEDQGDEIVEDSIILKQLKKYWAMADSYEKELFIDWLESRKEI